MPDDQRGERVFDSEIQGRVSLDPSAEVHDSLIRGPVAIGPRARITNAYIGPYTSIGADVQIDCVEIEHSIVLDRAQLRSIGTRIEGSLIGPDARVTRDFRMPQAIRLVGRRGRGGRDLVTPASGGGARALAGHRHRAALEPPQLLLDRAATAVVQAVDRVLGAAEPLGDLAGREAHEVTQHDDGALILGQRRERLADDLHVVRRARSVRSSGLRTSSTGVGSRRRR